MSTLNVLCIVIVSTMTDLYGFPDQMGFSISTGLQSSPLSSSTIGSITSGSVLGSIKYYRFYGWSSDHAHAAAILSASASPTDIKFIIEIIPFKVDTLSNSDIDDLITEWNDMVSNIYCIALGNEPLLNGNTFNILPTKLNMVYERLKSKPGWENVTVSIPFSGEIFESSWPVPQSTFKSQYKENLTSIISIYQSHGAPFSMQWHPFFVALSNPELINYILGEEPLEYSCMLAAQYMATWYAMNDALSNSGVEIIITETGWSSYSSDSTYWFATLSNANKFYQNTLKLMNDPSSALYNKRIYFLELFDEDLKNGGVHEKHFGFYDSSGNLKIAYNPNISAPTDISTAAPTDFPTAAPTDQPTPASTELSPLSTTRSSEHTETVSLPDQMGFTLSTGLQSSPLSSATIGSITSSSTLESIKYYRFYGWESDHAHAAAIVSASSSPTDIKFIIEIAPDRVDTLSNADIDAFVTEWNDLVLNVYCIALGNERLLYDNTLSILPTKLNMVYERLKSEPGWDNVTVSIPFSGAIFESSWPVPQSTFKSQYKENLTSIILIYKMYGAPFSIQWYPFFVMVSNPELINYILGEEAGEYSCMLAAQYMATWYAMEDALSDNGVEIIITETGWATDGGANFWFATVENANKYYQNTLRLMKDPNSELYNKKIYFFELFDEDLKSGGNDDIAEKNFGFYDKSGNLKITYHPNISAPPAPTDNPTPSPTEEPTSSTTEQATLTPTDNDASSGFSDDGDPPKVHYWVVIIICVIFVLVVIVFVAAYCGYKKRQVSLKNAGMTQIEENDEEMKGEQEIEMADEQEIEMELVNDVKTPLTQRSTTSFL